MNDDGAVERGSGTVAECVNRIGFPRGDLSGWFPRHAGKPVSRRLQRPYLIRGWCLTKLNGFRFLKAARDDVRLNVHNWRDDVADSRAGALRQDSLMNEKH